MFSSLWVSMREAIEGLCACVRLYERESLTMEYASREGLALQRQEEHAELSCSAG